MLHASKKHWKLLASCIMLYTADIFSYWSLMYQQINYQVFDTKCWVWLHKITIHNLQEVFWTFESQLLKYKQSVMGLLTDDRSKMCKTCSTTEF